jgi:hypothetical protein
MKRWSYACALCTLLWARAVHAEPTRVCVEVIEKQWFEPVPPAALAPEKPKAAAPAKGETPSAAAETLPEAQPPAEPADADKSIAALEPQPAPAAKAKPDQGFNRLPASVAAAADAGPELAPARPAIDPERYLRRLVEYQVAHHPRYDAVQTGCKERLTVELYALDRGWTVFARFSEFAREEKVDRVLLDEFGALADRLTRALLADTSVQDTLDRENVLRADSEEHIRRVGGQSHFQLAMGTALRVGRLPSAGKSGVIHERYRFASPLALSIGARNKFRGWALDPFARVQIGTSEYVPETASEPGGHVDFAGSGSLGLHFMRYANPRGIGSLYYGGGAQFELARYKVTEAGKRGRDGEHDGLWTGGLDVDLLAGYEFMRASTLHFFVQIELSLPAYTATGHTKSGGLDNAYVPSAVAQVGLLL